MNLGSQKAVEKHACESSTAKLALQSGPFIRQAFWFFVLCSVGGLLLEEIYHLVVFHELENRAGLLFGPFSPLYGIGGLCIAALSKAAQRWPLPLTFLVFALTGGALEFATSLLMQSVFGILAWDYSGTWLNIDGRTNGFFMIAWGTLGMMCARMALPAYRNKLAPLIDRIPTLVTWVCLVLMLANVVLTVGAFDSWYRRMDDTAMTTPIQTFYAEHFDNAYMEDHFQTMSMFPDDATRPQKRD